MSAHIFLDAAVSNSLTAFALRDVQWNTGATSRVCALGDRVDAERAES